MCVDGLLQTIVIIKYGCETKMLELVIILIGDGNVIKFIHKFLIV